MRKPVLVLSLTTALFAASTLYLAWRLYGVDPAGVSNAGNPEPERQVQAAAAAVVAASKTASAATTAAPVAVTTPAATREDHERELVKGFASQWLAKFDDPAQRGILIEESRLRLRRQYLALKERLKLDNATFEQLLTTLAEQEMAPQERYFRCVVNPTCDPKEFQRHAAPLDDRSAELNALLGEDLDEFTRYRDSLSDRETVTQLRGRLNEANTLRDEQGEKLVAALTEERTRYQTDAAQRGETLNGWGTPLGMLYFPGDSSSVEQRLTGAADYSRRLRERAATVLTPQQLAVFGQIQDELLAAMRTTMRSPG